MTINIHKDNGANWAVRDGSGKPVIQERHHHGLDSMRTQTRQAVLVAAQKHELIFLERLQKAVDERGPDGVIVRNDFDACLLAVLIDVLRESEALER